MTNEGKKTSTVQEKNTLSIEQNKKNDEEYKIQNTQNNQYEKKINKINNITKGKENKNDIKVKLDIDHNNDKIDNNKNNKNENNQINNKKINNSNSLKKNDLNVKNYKFNNKMNKKVNFDNNISIIDVESYKKENYNNTSKFRNNRRIVCQCYLF